ncbi:MAG: sigma-54 dependent transcriptional regulator [Spongiibacteraceae bacterium]|jgi:two-component system response regulator PilR (NtrC family)|nr:sigma-54 dependent transcriptional regulator [Spongiibacteraceae bacterium]
MSTQHPITVLIVDDEPDIRELLEITLSRMGLQTETADSVASAREQLAQLSVHLCLTDMKLPDGNGVELIQHIQQHCPQVPVAMITAYGSMETAIDALKAGAFDFITKPVDLERLRTLVQSSLRLNASPTAAGQADTSQLVGNTPVMQELRKQIAKVARSQAPIYISGESGSGKEVVARLIHANGPRHHGPFVPVNCGAIPGELMESEFFGHVKGSFTGAHEDKKGLFEAADGGTLFLDEVADLPLAMQVKLLRAIQEKSVRKVGSNTEIAVDVRILSATHKNLLLEVEQGRFRSDLFYRINVIEIRVPSLRERSADIPLLADHLLAQLALEWQIPKPRLSPAAARALSDYPFPGNVRELQNVLERAYTLAEGEVIEADDLQLPEVPLATPPSDTGLDFNAFESLEAYLEETERQILRRALDQHRWNRTVTASALGMTFRQLRYRLQKLGLDKDDEA